MSYLVLARKYRPKSFTEMVGQEHVVRALGNALQTQRLHHAYLFTGTRGVGKTTVSRILAKSLNCVGADGQGGITDQPCGVCQACTDIDSGRFVDYTELDAASNRGVDEVQSLLEQAVYKPVQGRFKVFMIDEVHMLSNTAFNAMLKTLEEPPEYLKFVLATTDPQKVPVTVLSRCLQFNLRPMAPETVLEHLTKVLAAENVPAEPGALRLLARAARGSMRDALSLTDQAIAFGSGQLEEATVRQMLGSVDRSHVYTLIDALARGDGKTVVDTSETLRVNGLSAASTLEEMSVVLQRMAVLQAVPGSADASDPEAAEMARLAALLPADETQLLYSLCLHGRGELGLAPDEYAALTMVLLRLLAFKPGAMPSGGASEKKTLKSPESAPARPQPVMAAAQAATPVHAVRSVASMPAVPAPPVAARPIAAPAAPRATGAMPPGQVLSVVDDEHPVQPARPVTAMPAAQVVAVPVRVPAESRADAPAPGAGQGSPLVPTEEGGYWHQVVRGLIASESITALVRELALQSQLVARDADQWLLRVERESLNSASSRERLQAALQAAGHGVTLAVEIGRVSDSPARRNAAIAEEKQLAAEKLIHEDPFVQAMMRDFGAKIVPGSIKPIEPNGSSKPQPT
ncbi:MAG: DNA polymerase III subunit gamma/tau [Hylemonella sp.]|uniref:DNA polymerase III subunit gamma/tau n=1 Tax=Hylemonella sp. TaxID=2066020 RepID=UPI00391A42A9